MKVGGWGNVVTIVGPERLNMFPPLDSEFPWLGLLLAAPIVGIWYWCTDQCIVQRTLAARDETNARRGAIWAAYLKLFPFFIFLIPGIIAYALKQTGQLEYEVADQVFPTMVKSLLPVGIRGLVAGGLLAALMSSLAAVFNGCSTLFTMDIYKKLRPNASELTLVRVGRIATVVVVGLGILWIPILRGFSSSLYQYLQNVQAYIAPPITAVFLLGLFWKRINGTGALAALVGGFCLGMTKLTVEVFEDSLSGILLDYAEINFLYFAPLLFLCSVAIMIVGSVLTGKPEEKQLEGLTYSTTVAEDKQKSRESWDYRDVFHTAVILTIIALIMIYFSPLGVAG
jgi:SSS family solute:Na+ symporter